MTPPTSSLLLCIAVLICIYAVIILLCVFFGKLMVDDSELHNWKQCSWCKIWMADGIFQTEEPANVKYPVSHGICPDCYEKQMEEIERLRIESNKNI